MLIRAMDVDLGSPRDAHQPVKDAFERRGVPISNQLITRLRLGLTRPARTAYRLACADALRADDASLKTSYCLEVVSVGCEHRRPSREPPRVYACLGLTRAMAAALACTHLQLRQVLLTMRADLALWSTEEAEDQLVAEFRDAASLFLRVHRHRDWRVWHSVNDIVNVAWDKETIHGFYFALCTIAGSLTRAAWLPYELNLFRSFYLRQRELGDRLTPLDREVLTSAVVLKPTALELARVVRAQVVVEYDQNCLTTHRHLLVTGSPAAVRGSRSRPSNSEIDTGRMGPPTSSAEYPCDS